jgi:predicted aspartyl protease
MRVLLFVLSSLVLLPTSLVTAASMTVFELGDQGGIIVPVRLNDAGPFRLLLDTGATNTAITAGVAAAIGAPAVATANVISPTQSSRRTVVVVDKLELGPSPTDLVLASVVPDRSFDRAGRIQGLIGQDILAHLRFTIDFRRRQLRWHADEAPPHGVGLHLALVNGRFVVDLPQPDGTLRMVPDSGAGAIVLFSTERRGASWLRRTGRSVEVETANGRATAMEVVLPFLQVGGRTLRDLAGVTMDRPESHPADSDGLLPVHWFDRVTFDGPRRMLFLG